MPSRKPHLRHFERRTAHKERTTDIPQLDRRKHPLHTPMGEAQRISTISDNYANLMHQAGRDGPSPEFMGMLRERYEAMKNRHLNRLVNFSERDDLTGLLNKRGFKLRTRFYVTNPKRVFSYVYIDMNNLKKINDQLGHNVGNTYLEIVGLAATELSRKYSESDIKFTFARTGGDEFEMLISCPRERGHDYDRVTKTIISELYSIAKELWKGQKTRVVKEYGIDAPDMAFASGYSVAAIPCSVAITDVRDYEKLTTKDIDHIDKYLDSLRSTAETEMYKHADMKGGNGRI